MDFVFLHRLAQKDPALARAFEIAIYTGFYYLLWVVVSGQIWSAQTFFVLICTPLSAYMGKKLRDIETKYKQEYLETINAKDSTSNS